MTNQLSLLLVFALGLGVARSVHGGQPLASGTVKPVQVALAPFDLWGNASVEIADAISTSLTALLQDDACFEVVSRTSPSVAYVVEGSMQAEPKRRIAALRIGDPKTGGLFWSENYDYTNISGDMMARDVFKVLQALTRSYCHPDVARTEKPADIVCGLRRSSSTTCAVISSPREPLLKRASAAPTPQSARLWRGR